MLEEQQLGGLLMWVGFGASIRLITALAVLMVYVREEEAKEPWKKREAAARAAAAR